MSYEPVIEIIEPNYPEYMDEEQLERLADWNPVGDTQFGEAACGCVFVLPANDERVSWIKCKKHST